MIKKVFFTCLIVSSATFLSAQDNAKPASDATPAKTEVKAADGTVTHKVVVKNYCCASCDYVSTKQGTCPHHKNALIRDGLFYCADGTVSREAGKCKDGKDMIKMVDKSGKRTEIKTDQPTTVPATLETVPDPAVK